ncbi:MAG: hypothetical protein ACSLFC_07895 [Desulfuromonadales bacterium]
MTATTTNRELWREAIRITLAHRAGDAPDASAVAEATASTWRQVAALLTPVIGARGVDVIFRRALSLTSKIFQWLALGEAQGDSVALLVSLKAQLAGQETDVAAEAGCTLMVTFIELLTTLIGESLTERMVSPVWASPLPPSEQEAES